MLLEKIRNVLGYMPDHYYETNERIEFELQKGLTFQDLGRLSEACGTERINLLPADPGYNYSSYTYDSGTPAKVEILL